MAEDVARGSLTDAELTHPFEVTVAIVENRPRLDAMTHWCDRQVGGQHIVIGRIEFAPGHMSALAVFRFRLEGDANAFREAFALPRADHAQAK